MLLPRAGTFGAFLWREAAIRPDLLEQRAACVILLLFFDSIVVEQIDKTVQQFTRIWHWSPPELVSVLSALASAQELSMTYEEGLAHYEIGRHLELDDASRAAHLDEARVLFRGLHASHALAALEIAAMVSMVTA